MRHGSSAFWPPGRVVILPSKSETDAIFTICAGEGDPFADCQVRLSLPVHSALFGLLSELYRVIRDLLAVASLYRE